MKLPLLTSDLRLPISDSQPPNHKKSRPCPGQLFVCNCDNEIRRLSRIGTVYATACCAVRLKFTSSSSDSLIS